MMVKIGKNDIKLDFLETNVVKYPGLYFKGSGSDDLQPSHVRPVKDFAESLDLGGGGICNLFYMATL